MNRLDERLKERARREDCPVPQGFDGRMDAILEGLPEGRKKPGPRRLRRWAVAGVLAAALCVGGVAAASGALELIARRGLLAEDGLVVWESEREEVAPAGWQIADRRRYGRAKVVFFREQREVAP